MAARSRTTRQFLNDRAHIAVVTNGLGAVVGIVTLEDLLKTVLGVEIVDELDHVDDLRSEAMQLRDERLKGRPRPGRPGAVSSPKALD
jgi:CBS domain containing-hemolysin-like protein